MDLLQDLADSELTMSRPIKSAVAIAQLLDCEGFSDHTANQVKRYWMASVCKRHEKMRIARKRKAFQEMAKAKLTDGDRIILGKWISVIMKQSFDTGLRMGLTASLHPLAEEVNGVESTNHKEND